MMARRVRLWVVFFSLFMLWAAGCASRQVEKPAVPVEAVRTPRYGGIYNYPLQGDPLTLDPARVNDTVSHAVAGHIFDGLVRFDENLAVVPAIAERWEESPDGRVWAFQLRRGVKFHNGREVKAADFKYSLERVVAPKTGSEKMGMFGVIRGARAFSRGKAGEVSGIKVLGDYALRIELEQPFSAFLSVLAMPNAAVIPREEVEGREGKFSVSPVGTGPFKFVEWEPRRRVVLTANNAYYAGQPYLDGIVFKIIPDVERMFIEFEMGGLDETEVPVTDLLRIREDERYRDCLITRPVLATFYIAFNTQKRPFAERKFRVAISHAVDKKEFMAEDAEGERVVAVGVLPPGMPGYTGDFPRYDWDIEKAKTLLADLGWRDADGDGIIEKDGRPCRIDYWFSAGAGQRAMGSLIRSSLRRVGIEVALKQLQWGDFIDAVNCGDAPMFSLGWVADYPDPDNFLYVLFHSENKGPGGNGAFYSNPAVDSLLSEARICTEEEKRLELYRKAEGIIVEDAPWIFLYHPAETILVQRHVRDRVVNAMGAHGSFLTRTWLAR